MVNCGMLTKWIFTIDRLKNYRVGEDKKIYRIPVNKGLKHYGAREIKKQYPNRYRLNDSWFSENQLRKIIDLDPNPILLFKSKEMPF